MKKVTKSVGDYELLIGDIGRLLENARNHIASAVNTVLVETYWHIGKYIVEYEQKGDARAQYGSNLLNLLSRDLSLKYGKGFGRSNLQYMRKLYICFPKCGTVSRVLSWSHYYEILKADDPLEISFYTKECEKARWSVRELKRQMKSMLFHRLALSKDKQGGACLAVVNARFNAQLARQIAGTLPAGHIYQLGHPGPLLRAAGFPDSPIEMSATRLAEKSMQRNHQFDLADVKNLPEAMQNPLGVFAYGNRFKSENVIVSLDKDGKKFVVGVFFNQKRGSMEVSSVRGIFNKNSAEWLNWITQGKAVYLNKEKIQALIDQQRTNLADVTYLDLDSATKILQNFENPK